MPRGVAKDHDEKRAALRKGAAAYFALHGFDRASMTAVAKDCGVSKALLYHYYANKETLLHDILAAHLSDLAESARSAAPAGMRQLIAAILEAYEDADAEHKLQLESLHLLPDDLRSPLIALQRDLVGLMSATIERDRPGLSPDQLRAASMTVFGILNWVYLWHRPGRGMSRKDYADFAARFVEGGLNAIA
jgi:AcrR family transcriptional regulator